TLLSKEMAKTHKLEGTVKGVLTLVHDEKDEIEFSEAKHRFEKIIKTLIHNQLGKNKCLELFIIEGDCKEVNELMIACRKSGKTEYLKLITTN
ncbi:MAG: nickel-responsive regulator 1, partial [Candidatus Altiarchaeota archaeon]|nr:nickel-responsive regulator 1 [Candidatus Altiarchaeota archaeon]